MDLGVRQIRTAGKGSGSVELTLPKELRELVGLPCRVTLRDGNRPDIVLQPDLAPALATFTRFWAAMAAILWRGDDLPPFPLSQLSFGLRQRANAGDSPYLCWPDGLALAAARLAEPACVSRTVAAFGHAIAAELGIAVGLAPGFGAACGLLVTGVPPSPDTQEACDLAAAGLRGRVTPGAALAEAEGTLGTKFWRHAAPALTANAELFAGWTADPACHAVLRGAWRRGRSIEMLGD